jgi:protein-tyrosine phosphatase/Fe-S-cluster containining protein
MKLESGSGFISKLLKFLDFQSLIGNLQSRGEQSDSAYQLTWITEYLAVGYAPMSHIELESIKEQGIDAIVNLCAEFCDLHEIEEQSGFEVYYLPIPDETAPNMEEMENALAWLDEAIYLGKKILIHCRHGIGRTGTFVTSYLLRRGLGLKVASKKMKYTRATPSNYSQWKLLRKYRKKSGVLTIREPSLEAKNVVDLSTYFAEYEALVQKTDEDIKKAANTTGKIKKCGLETDECCFRYVDLQLIEVIYLSNLMNRTLASDLRTEVICRAVEVCKKTRGIKARLNEKGYDPNRDKKALIETYVKEKILCPLNRESRCSLYEYRPLQCRLHGVPDDSVDLDLINNTLSDISRNVFFAFSGSFLEQKNLSFSLADTVSGRFVQEYFYYLASLAAE